MNPDHHDLFPEADDTAADTMETLVVDATGPIEKVHITTFEREPLPVEMLVPSDQRRLAVALDDHPKPWDDIPLDPPNKRSAKEIGRVLSILDSLERGNA